jgi:hypothetical protein
MHRDTYGHHLASKCRKYPVWSLIITIRCPLTRLSLHVRVRIPVESERQSLPVCLFKPTQTRAGIPSTICSPPSRKLGFNRRLLNSSVCVRCKRSQKGIHVFYGKLSTLRTRAYYSQYNLLTSELKSGVRSGSGTNSPPSRTLGFSRRLIIRSVCVLQNRRKAYVFMIQILHCHNVIKNMYCVVACMYNVIIIIH